MGNYKWMIKGAEAKAMMFLGEGFRITIVHGNIHTDADRNLMSVIFNPNNKTITPIILPCSHVSKPNLKTPIERNSVPEDYDVCY